MEIQSLNNATLLITSGETKLLIDPWLVGDLYHGSWSPAFMMHDLSFLSSVNVVYISHIHEDHWDRETLDLIDRNATIIIPSMKVNGVIERGLRDLGFLNIRYISIGENSSISDSITIRALPPFNSLGQDIERYTEGYESDATDVDTAILVSDKITMSNHLVLCDNSPYDLGLLKTQVTEELTTFWYPFNSYAMDYPVCYDMSAEERGAVHDTMHNKTKAIIKDAVSFLRPDYFFPHSADFVLNGPRSEDFLDYTKPEFVDRKKVAKNFASRELTDRGIKSDYVNPGDKILVSKSGDIEIKRDVVSYLYNQPSGNDLAITSSKVIDSLSDDLKQGLSLMKQRLSSYAIALDGASDWVVIFEMETEKVAFCFDHLKIIDAAEAVDRKTLKIRLDDQLMSALLYRDIHWNNAMIGCHLSYERIPNEYCQPLYKALNFLHL